MSPAPCSPRVPLLYEQCIPRAPLLCEQCIPRVPLLCEQCNSRATCQTRRPAPSPTDPRLETRKHHLPPAHLAPLRAILLTSFLASTAFVTAARADTTPSTHASDTSASRTSGSTGAAPAPATLRHDPRMDRWRRAFGWGLLLMVIFITAAAAIIIFSRRYRAFLQAGDETPATPSDDVWAMHKLPPDAYDSGDDKPAG